MKISENVPFSKITFYEIGGIARTVISCDSSQAVFDALEFIKRNNFKKILVLGMGANILLPDNGFDGVVLHLRGVGQDIHENNEQQITAFAGESMEDLIDFSLKRKLTGLEWAGGLPSSIGGAIRGNAGAFGSEIKDSLYSIEAVNLDDTGFKVKRFFSKDLSFSYRHSFLKDNPKWLVLRGTFQLKNATNDELMIAKEQCRQNILYRKNNHPMEYPSCGSVFKNIIKREEVEKVISIWPDVGELSKNKWHSKISMGYVIKRLGFSGMRIGGAQVSEKHTNYIVNINHAKSKDVQQIISKIRQEFQRVFTFSPELEVVIQ